MPTPKPTPPFSPISNSNTLLSALVKSSNLSCLKSKWILLLASLRKNKLAKLTTKWMQCHRIKWLSKPQHSVSSKPWKSNNNNLSLTSTNPSIWRTSNPSKDPLKAQLPNVKTTLLNAPSPPNSINHLQCPPIRWLLQVSASLRSLQAQRILIRTQLTSEPAMFWLIKTNLFWWP